MMTYRKKRLTITPVIDWSSPTAEDVAAGLSEQQAAALLGKPDPEAQAVSSLQEGVAGWRPPLMRKRTMERTVFGDEVAQVTQSSNIFE